MISILSTAASSIIQPRPLHHLARRSFASVSSLSHRYDSVPANDCLPSSRHNGLTSFSPSITFHGITNHRIRNSSNNSSIHTTRFFSDTPSPPPTGGALPPPPPPLTHNNIPPPTSLTPEAGLAAQDAMRLFVEHGIGKRALEMIAEETRQGTTPFLDRWQKMIQIYLQTQCAVIQLLGYTPDEHGISLYTQHLSQAMQLSSPDVQEQLRTTSRDTYRTVLGGAFGMDLITEQRTKGELSIVDARNMMHKVSLRMQDDSVLEKVARACSGEGGSVVSNDSEEGRAMELAYKHTAIQKIMVYDVYLSGSPCLVEECGFGKGEAGYVRMQGALADHQSDPLISQYVGGAMLKLLESAGIDMKNWQTPR